MYSYDELAERVDCRLSSNPHSSLAELAADIQIDRHTILTALKHVRGITFARYRRLKLLEKALSLLTCASVHSVKEVAYELRFKSPQSFTRFVKANTRMTPSQIMRKRPTLS